MKAFQAKLAGLTFLDPACGSGNFLTETYISLRRLENEVLKVDRLMERGRVTLHEIPFREFQILARPDDPAVAPYRKGGGEKVKKYDYTSYADGVPWYTLIAREDGKTVKLLLDLNDEAIRAIRRSNREAVRV